MLGLFKKRNKQLPILNLKHQLKEAFSRVNRDISHIRQWIDHLAERSQSLEDSHFSHQSTVQKDIQNLHQWIQYLHQHNLELQNFVKEVTSNLEELHKKDSAMLDKLNSLEKQYENLKNEKEARKKSEVRVRTRSEPGSGSGLSEPGKPGKFEEKMMFKLKSRKKDYVMKEMLELINSKDYSTKELEEKIVKEQNLCGRTTFYDYLKELRNKGVVGYRNVGARKVLAETGSDPNL